MISAKLDIHSSRASCDDERWSHPARLPHTAAWHGAYPVVWTRKGESDTIAAVDKIVQEWHRSGWLIATEKRIGITPPQPLLPELQARFKSPT